jgi:hypothetical protein
MKAAPEGVAMIRFGINFEACARLAEEVELNAIKKDSLLRVCGDLGLTAEQTSDIVFVALVLHDFELHEKPKLKTPVERRRAIEEVERLGHAFHRALRELERPDLDDIEWRMPADNLRAMTHIEARHESSTGVIGLEVNAALVMRAQPELLAEMISFSTVYPVELGRAGHVGKEAERLAHSASELRGSIGDEGRNGGRKNTLRYYAWHVDKIAECVEQKAMGLGRGGDFERLCDAVWSAADVPSKAAGAIREFGRLRALHQDVPQDQPF